MPLQESDTRVGPDGRSYKLMCLGGFWFEVSWRTQKAEWLQNHRGIDFIDAARVLDDPGLVIVPENDPGYEAPYRAIGFAPSGRLLTLALDITYPDGEEDAEDVGFLRVYTAILLGTPAVQKGHYVSHEQQSSYIYRARACCRTRAKSGGQSA